MAGSLRPFSLVLAQEKRLDGEHPAPRLKTKQGTAIGLCGYNVLSGKRQHHSGILILQKSQLLPSAAKVCRISLALA